MPFGKNSIQIKNRAAVKAGLNFNDIKSFPIIIPPLSLQSQFAEIVEKTEILKIQYKASLLELENLFGSLSQKAFKGELDLSKMELTYEEEYSVTDNDRTEESDFNKPVNYETVEVSRLNKGVSKGEEESIWETTRSLVKPRNLAFNNKEGDAVLQKVFSKKIKGFLFKEFEAFLEKEGFQMNYQIIKDFVIEKLQSKELIQYYGSEEWMQKWFKKETGPTQDDFAGDGIIWLVPNNNKK